MTPSQFTSVLKSLLNIDADKCPNEYYPQHDAVYDLNDYPASKLSAQLIFNSSHILPELCITVNNLIVNVPMLSPQSVRDFFDNYYQISQTKHIIQYLDQASHANKLVLN